MGGLAAIKAHGQTLSAVAARIPHHPPALASRPLRHPDAESALADCRGLFSPLPIVRWNRRPVEPSPAWSCSRFCFDQTKNWSSSGYAAGSVGVMRTQQRSHRRFTVTKPRTEPNSAPSGREAALKAHIDKLEEALQARDDFIAIAAHELRNSMTPISARLELLLSKAAKTDGGGLPGYVQGLSRLERLVDAHMRRVTVLLEVSRINSGNLRLQLAEVSLSELVRQVAMKMVPVAERARCSVQLTIQECVSGQFDAMAMEQVLENLLSNAVRYGPGKPIELALSSDARVARLSVRDEGIGISEQDQSQLFKRFYTLPHIDARAGFGVGLWVTRRLVHAMQGEITVSSKLGLGSTFAVKLPLRPRGINGY
jgi:signal transduction histidine kinase